MSDEQHIALLTEVNTNVKWLMNAHEKDHVERNEMALKIRSLELSRSRLRGGSVVLGAVSTLSITLYKFFGGGVE